MIVVIYFVSCTIKVYDIGYFLCVFVCIVEIVCPFLNLGVKQSDPISLAHAHKQWPVLRLHEKAI